MLRGAAAASSLPHRKAPCTHAHTRAYARTHAHAHTHLSLRLQNGIGHVPFEFVHVARPQHPVFLLVSAEAHVGAIGVQIRNQIPIIHLLAISVSHKHYSLILLYINNKRKRYEHIRLALGSWRCFSSIYIIKEYLQPALGIVRQLRLQLGWRRHTNIGGDFLVTIIKGVSIRCKVPQRDVLTRSDHATKN